MPLPIHIDDPLSVVCPRRFLSQINDGWRCIHGHVDEWSHIHELGGERVVAHPRLSACSAGAETIVYDRGLLLLAGLV